MIIKCKISKYISKFILVKYIYNPKKEEEENIPNQRDQIIYKTEEVQS